MLSKNGFYRLLHLRSLLCTPSSKRLYVVNIIQKKVSTFPSPWVNSTDLPARNICEKEKGNELLPETHASDCYKILMFITFGSSYHCEVG